MDLEFLVTINYAPCVGILFMLVFLQINGRTDRVIRKTFLWLLALEFAELVVYSLELLTAVGTEPSMLRVLLSAIGYTLRPVLAYLLILLNMRDGITRKKVVLTMIPLMINTVVAFSAFFTDIAYSYTANNQFVRGPLGYTSQIVTILYILALGIVATRNRKQHAKLETVVVYLSIVLVIFAIVIEAVHNIRSLGRTTIVMATVFYYMYFQSYTYQSKLDTEKHMRMKLQQDSYKDNLTGLLNKTAFTKQVDRLLEKKYISSALFFFDLDHFKEFNDTLGHLTGDELLKEVAQRLNSLFRNTDVIGRFGGDEFYVYMTDVPYSIVEEKAKKLLTAMQIVWDGEEVDITASIGICYVPPEIQISSEEALYLADTALYRAKGEGRNCFRIYIAGEDNDK